MTARGRRQGRRQRARRPGSTRGPRQRPAEQSAINEPHIPHNHRRGTGKVVPGRTQRTGVAGARAAARSAEPGADLALGEVRREVVGVLVLDLGRRHVAGSGLGTSHGGQGRGGEGLCTSSTGEVRPRRMPVTAKVGSRPGGPADRERHTTDLHTGARTRGTGRWKKIEHSHNSTQSPHLSAGGEGEGGVGNGAHCCSCNRTEAGLGLLPLSCGCEALDVSELVLLVTTGVFFQYSDGFFTSCAVRCYNLNEFKWYWLYFSQISTRHFIGHMNFLFLPLPATPLSRQAESMQEK